MNSEVSAKVWFSEIFVIMNIDVDKFHCFYIDIHCKNVILSKCYKANKE